MMQHSPRMNAALASPARRRLFQLGAGAALLLAVTGGAAWLWRPGWRAGRLTDSGRRVMGAFARAALEGSLPADNAALDEHLDRVGEAIGALPPAAQDDWARLLGLLALAPGRRWITGLQTDWPVATLVDLEAALRRMRLSDDTMPRQAYAALRDINTVTFHAQPSCWALAGYPGPSDVSR
jgi:hypothetical protein